MVEAADLEVEGARPRLGPERVGRGGGATSTGAASAPEVVELAWRAEAPPGRLEHPPLRVMVTAATAHDKPVRARPARCMARSMAFAAKGDLGLMRRG